MNTPHFLSTFGIPHDEIATQRREACEGYICQNCSRNLIDCECPRPQPILGTPTQFPEDTEGEIYRRHAEEQFGIDRGNY